MVQDTKWEQGLVEIPTKNPVFKNTKLVYIKELVTLSVKAPAKAIVSEGGDNIIATAKVGKGSVFIVGDPWLYNEYTDGRRIPNKYENFSAAKDLAKWALGVK
jgi:unsaturated rhamnogalacturonyl hydrolase